MPPRPNEARREQLLDQIQEIFLAEGFLQSRVGGLADRLHCSRSTLYKLAPSKEELFTLVVERYADSAVYEAMARAEAHAAPVDKVAAFIETIATWQHKGGPKFWSDAMEFQGTAARFNEKRAWGVRVLRGYLDEGIARGEFRPANTAFIAHVIWMGMLATRDSSVLDRVGLDRRGAALEIGNLLLFGMSHAQPVGDESDPRERPKGLHPVSTSGRR